MPADDAVPGCTRAADRIVDAIARRQRGHGKPLVVALDGGSGAGKSALARLVARATDAVVVPTDDFYAAEISDEEWAACSPALRVDRCIDWQRLRREALEPLRAGQPATYFTYEYPIRTTADGVAMHPVTLHPAPVMILDGIYSARPELADLLDLTVLVDAPQDIRYERHDARERGDQSDWHRIWDAAESHYLRVVRPPSSFDLVVRSD